MIYILLFIAFLISDLVVKHWAVNILKEAGSMTVIENILALTYAENKGAAFSMLSGARWFFVIVAAAFLIALLVMYKKNYFTTWWSKLGAVMVASGTVGNAIDRMRYGYVVDMFEFRFVKFAIFNVADVFITMGAVLFCIYIFFFDTLNKKRDPIEDVIKDLEREIEEYQPPRELETAFADYDENEVSKDE